MRFARKPLLVAYWTAMVVVFSVTLTPDPAVRFVGSIATPWLAAAALAVGARRHVEGRRWPWMVLSAGHALVGVGMMVVALRLYVWDVPVTPISPGDVMYVGGYLSWVVAYFGIARTASTRRDSGVVLDIAVAIAGIVAPLHKLVFEPIFEKADLPLGAQGVLLTYVVVDVCILTVVSRLLLGGARRSPALWLLISGMLVASITDLAYVALQANDANAFLANVVIGYTAAFALTGSAALLPSVRVLGRDSLASAPRLGPARLACLGAALMLPSITWVVVHKSGQEPRAVDILVPTAVLVGLVLTRLQRMFSAMRAATAETERRELYFRTLVEHISEHVSVTDAAGLVLDNTARQPHMAAAGQSIFDHIDRTSRRQFQASLRAVLDKPEELVTVLKSSHQHERGTKHYEVTVHNMLEVDHVRGVLWVTRDVTEKRFMEEELVHQALHDALTGLPNRVLFADRLAQAKARRDGHGVAVLFVDIDNFKTINDSLGHDAGDTLLHMVASRFRSVVRESDTVARLGGDEFAVLIELSSDADDASALARRVLDSLQMPVELLAQRVAVTASVGVAVARPGDTGDLLGQADIAMYQAKAAGKNTVVVFEQGMQTVASEQLQLAMELVDALEAGQLRVAYQPIVDLADESIVGVEALLRWDHPTRGVVPPLDFIPTAEENGLIVPIGRFVLDEACRQVQEWSLRHGSALKVSVNLSARQLDSESLVADVRTALATSGLPADRLVLELTESMLVRNVEGSVARLRELKELGVRVAVDDFGTGYSSLSYLQQFPIDVLKIDRSFVASMVSSEEAGAVVRALVDMGRALHLETLAEGVEERGQAELLRAENCDFAQGYLFAAPMPPDTVAQLLHRSPRTAAAEV